MHGYREPEFGGGNLVNYESVRAKTADHNADPVSAFHVTTLVREQHPILLSRFRGYGLPQLSDFIHLRYHQFHMRPLIDQRWLKSLIIERFGFLRIQHLVGE